MKLKDLAAQINAHLKRLEADPVANAPMKRDTMTTYPFFRAGAWAAGRFVQVVYVSYHGHDSLTKAEAENYLAWLDKGFTKTHHQLTRADAKKIEVMKGGGSIETDR